MHGCLRWDREFEDAEVASSLAMAMCDFVDVCLREKLLEECGVRVVLRQVCARCVSGMCQRGCACG